MFLFSPPVFESEFLYGDYLITQAFQTDDVVTTLQMIFCEVAGLFFHFTNIYETHIYDY